MALYWRDGEPRWHCKAAGCGAGGGAKALQAALRFGEIPGSTDPRWAELRDETVPRATVRPAPVAPPAYPPVTEVQAFWKVCLPLATLPPTDPVRGYLHTRGVNPERLSMLDLSRVFSADTPLPSWVPTAVVDTRVSDTGYRLVTPMFDALGTLRSIRFRATGPTRNGRKTLNPRGYGYAGLVMADPMALALLRGEADSGGTVSWDGRVVVVEGEPDFWTWASHPARLTSPVTWAVFGVAAGSWSRAIADRLPDRTRVIVRTHHDPAGEGYAARIRASFSGRPVVLLRSKPTES